MYTYKVLLHPNNKQRSKIRKTANKCIECQNIVFDYLSAYIKEEKKIPDVYTVRRWFTIQKEQKDKETIKAREGLTKKQQREKHLDVLFYDVSNDALKQTVKDTYNSFIRYFKKLNDYPIRKKYKSYKKSFYVDPLKIKFSDKYVKLEKITTSQKEGKQKMNIVRMVERNRIPQGVKYYNPRVVIEGERIWICVGVDDENKPKKEINNAISEEIGIDINIHSINISKGDEYKTPIGTKKIRRIEKSIKRINRKISKQELFAKNISKPKRKYKNLIKNYKRVNKKKRRLTNIVEGFQEEVINKIIQTNPKMINIEDLDIKEMLQNHKLAKNIQMSSWRKFTNKLKEKCDKYKITLNEIDKYYPSSQRCSKCGNIKKELTLKDRIYKCEKCGLIIKRDLNAAINIRDYKQIIKA